MRCTLPILVLALSTGCAASARNVERTFRRDDLAGVRLRSLDVIVFAAGPPRVAGERLDVRGFEPPRLDEPLFVGEEELRTRDAVLEVVTARLEAAGFEVAALLASAPAPSPIRTSSVASSTSSVAVAAEAAGRPLGSPPGHSPARVLAAEDATLRRIAAGSTADGILVVRLVPVDRFSIDVGSGSRVEVTALGRERVEDSRPIPAEGRLLLGQVFLFDRASMMRLWTKQVPDYPEAGRLVPGHPFLEYGYVHDGARGPMPSERELAALAASRFGARILSDFPAPGDGTERGRLALLEADPEREARIAQFFDEGHLGVEVGTRWSLQRAGLELELGGRALPSLETGAIAPSGVFSIAPRLSYLSPGGVELAVALSFGFAPGSFSRSYWRDPESPTLADPDARAATVRVEGARTFCAEATIGLAIPISPRVFLVPSVGPAVEVWSLDGAPASVVGETERLRLGAASGIDLWLRTADDGGFYGRIGAAAAVDVDTSSGEAGAAARASASLGVFL